MNTNGPPVLLSEVVPSAIPQQFHVDPGPERRNSEAPPAGNLTS